MNANIRLFTRHTKTLVALAVILVVVVVMGGTQMIWVHAHRADIDCVNSAISLEDGGGTVSVASCNDFVLLQRLVHFVDGNDLEGAKRVGSACIATARSPLAQFYCRRFLDVVNLETGAEYSGEYGRFTGTPEFARHKWLAPLTGNIYARTGRVGLTDPVPVRATLPNASYQTPAQPTVHMHFVSDPPRFAAVSNAANQAVVLPAWRGIVVQASVNGFPVRLFVDTGAPFTAISQRVADSAGMVRHPSNLRIRLLNSPLDNASEVGEATLGFSGGSSVRHIVRVFSTHSFEGTGIDGVLGLDYLRRYNRITVNLASHELTLGEFLDTGRCLPLHLVIYADENMLGLESSISIFGRSMAWRVDTGMYRSVFYGTKEVMRWLGDHGMRSTKRRRIGDIVLDDNVAVADSDMPRSGSDVLHVSIDNLPGVTVDMTNSPFLDRWTDEAYLLGTPQSMAKSGFSIDMAAHKLCIQ